MRAAESNKAKGKSKKVKVRITDKFNRAHVREGSIEALPYESEAFTKLCRVNTTYFWPDPIVALAECRRVLKREGSLVLGFNAKNELERWGGHSAKDAEQGLFYCVSARVVG